MSSPPGQNRRSTLVGSQISGAPPQLLSMNQDAIYVCQLLAINPDDLIIRYVFIRSLLQIEHWIHSQRRVSLKRDRDSDTNIMKKNDYSK